MTALRAVAEELENRLRAEGLGGVADMVVKVKVEFARSQDALKALLRG